MKYSKLGYAPKEALEKANTYARRKSKVGEKIESVVPVRWNDGAQGFEITILTRNKGLNVFTVTEAEL